MTRLRKILFIAFLAVIVLLVAGISLTIGWRPFIGPRSRPTTSTKFEATPQRIERGKYIFTALSACQVCHSQHDYSQHGNPVIPGGLNVKVKDLAPGSYRLVVQAVDSEKHQALNRSVDFDITD